MSDPKSMDSFVDLRNYLTFLREYGYREIPLETELSIHPGIHKPQEKTKLHVGESNLISIPEGNQDNTVKLNAVREELGECTRCKLCKGRNKIVFGSGNPKARLVFVGEGPGADEDEQGLPFVGRAGQKLTEIIEKGMHLNREKDAYICNIVKCRPPENRDPEADEIAACKPFLIKQLHAIRPKVIVALGKPAASTLLGRPVAITKERGKWFEYEGIKLMLTLHPAYLIRAYTLENRQAVLSDMQQVLKALKE